MRRERRPSDANGAYPERGNRHYIVQAMLRNKAVRYLER